MIKPISENVLELMNFIFRDWGKNLSQLDTMELTDTADMCTCDLGLGGRRYVTPLDPNFQDQGDGET